jgi:hypothetical protein
MVTLGVGWRGGHLRRTHSREIETMRSEPQNAFDDRMKQEVYSSYLNPSMSSAGPTRGFD